MTIAVSPDLLLFIIIKSIDYTGKRSKQNRRVPFCLIGIAGNDSSTSNNEDTIMM